MTQDALLELLGNLGVERLRIRNNNITGSCPFHQESNPSWGMSLSEPHMHGCFSCGAKGTLFTFLTEIGGYSRIKAARTCDLSAEHFMPDLEKKELPTVKVIDHTELFPYSWDKKASAYLRQRKFPIWKLIDLGLVHHPKEHRLLFPWYLGTMLIGVTGRALDDNPAKTLPYFGTLKGLGLYLPSRKINPNKRFTLVEGELDAIRLYCAGFENVGALGFGRFTHAQRYLLLSRGVRDVRVFMDDDLRGRQLTGEILEKLAGIEASVVDYAPFRDNYEKKLDPAEMSAEDIKLAMRKSTHRFSDWPTI